VHTVFSVMYLEHSQNEYLSEYFDDYLKHDFQSMKIVLDIVAAVMKRA